METVYTKIEAHNKAWEAIANNVDEAKRGQYRVLKNRGYYDVVYGRSGIIQCRFRFKK